jgi:hypothetical protein
VRLDREVRQRQRSDHADRRETAFVEALRRVNNCSIRLSHRAIFWFCVFLFFSFFFFFSVAKSLCLQAPRLCTHATPPFF